MTLHDKIAEMLHERNDNELGDFEGPRWAAFIECDVLEAANEAGIDLSFDELDEVHGAAAAVIHRIGDETEMHLFGSRREARLCWDEIVTA